MKSVADSLRLADRKELLSLTPTERVRLALALGERDLEMFRSAHRPPLSREEAARLLERQRQSGRRHSRCHEALIG